MRALALVGSSEYRTYVVTLITPRAPVGQRRSRRRSRSWRPCACPKPRAAATLEAVSELLERHRGLIALSGRESARVLKLWTQTIAAPVLSSMLFIVVFGLSLGGRIKQIGGVDYEVFIVPGLITMAMAQAAYSNNSSSVFQARSDRYLHDVLSAPMRAWEVNVGLSLGGVVRALAIGGALLAIAAPVTGVPVRQPLVLARRAGARARAVLLARRARRRLRARRGTRPGSSTTSSSCR